MTASSSIESSTFSGGTQNSGFFQLEPGPNKKANSLPLRDEDYTEDLKEVQAYLDKVKKIVRPGCSQEVLNVAVSSMSSLARILSAMSSKPKPRASL
ncbi:Pyrophosphate--fructose 6-phosphate 1-phosphotransferase subunit alpha [Camellia lanceoleosa]|uniref:Pyrophosphate--fructose 6-phosphate 1-phosphotransferase subunit alpha n=1 Tax=Camellia lanceoleosa TaxID=1840588 RepID=A0ACC0ILF3_9ERIC|nr:Pyrophosphate--fructose 6-phosphate 1-phosphotransferase subunit alpha [Camellia lanceoleosa]